MNFFSLDNRKSVSLLLLVTLMLFSLKIDAQCDNVTEGGTITGGGQTIGQQGDATVLTGVSPASGGTGPVQYLWMKTTQAGTFSNTTWTVIPGSTAADYDPPAGSIEQTTYFIRCAKNQNCSEYARESNIVVVYVDNALPVELLDFSGKSKDETIELKWTTASEYNHSHFVIERSTDGNTFEEIGLVEGDGRNSSEVKNYSFTDKNPLAKKNYYRLHQEDENGNASKSSVIVVASTIRGEINAGPNPTYDLMTVRVSGLPQDAAVLAVFNLQTGQIIRQKDISPDSNKYEINTEDFAPGLYVAHILSQSGKSINSINFIKSER